MDIVGVGYSCIDRLCTVEDYPPEDSSTHITQIDIQGGGAAATALVAASRLGKKTCFLGNIGRDAVSDEIVSLLEKDGVDCSGMVRRDDAFGLQSFVMVDPKKGTRTKFPQRDTNPDIEWTKGLKKAIKDTKILHLDGTNHANAMEAAKTAKGCGTLVSLDGASLKEPNELNLELARLADILIMNWRYPVRITGIEDYEKALLEIASWGTAKIVAGTQGSKGCKAVIDGHIEYFPAYPVDAVDTTGAGDVFHGAFLAGYLDGMELRENMRFASAAAALKCTEMGGRAGIPKKEEVLRFMERMDREMYRH